MRHHASATASAFGDLGADNPNRLTIKLEFDLGVR
jgi:hypothetical protein